MNKNPSKYDYKNDFLCSVKSRKKRIPVKILKAKHFFKKKSPSNHNVHLKQLQFYYIFRFSKMKKKTVKLQRISSNETLIKSPSNNTYFRQKCTLSQNTKIKIFSVKIKFRHYHVIFNFKLNKNSVEIPQLSESVVH